jgi:hypothetical protein
MALTVDTSIEMIRELWRQNSTSTVTIDVAKRYLTNAVIHVETLDYRQDNTYSITNDTITFTTTPTDISYMLYVYKALDMMANAIFSDEIDDDELGISWKSGMENISTATAGKIKKDLYDRFAKLYKDALNTAKLASHQSARSDIYGTFTNRT